MFFRYWLFMIVVLSSLGFHVMANTVVISDNGKKATLTIPLKATITVDSILRDTLTVIPMSGLYGTAKWDAAGHKFKDHEFLLRVKKNAAVPVLFEIINDYYTCSYINTNRMVALPDAVAVVNNGYQYSVKWSGGQQFMGGSRSVTIDSPGNWLTDLTTGEKFLDLTLNITFPDLTAQTLLMSKGGACHGAVTMLLSNKL